MKEERHERSQARQGDGALLVVALREEAAREELDAGEERHGAEQEPD